MPRPESHHSQRGAAALLTVTVLVILAAAGAGLAARSLWLDRLGADSRLQAQQARLAAESALAQAAARLQQTTLSGQLAAYWSQASGTQCPATHPPPGWQCLQQVWQEAAHDGRSPWQLQVTMLRHLTRSPHVVDIRASAQRADGSARSRAAVRQSLYQPALLPLPADAPGAALLVRGCVREAMEGSSRLCGRVDTGPVCSNPGLTAAVQSLGLPAGETVAEGERCLHLAPASLPGGSALLMPQAGTPAPDCDQPAWQAVLGPQTEDALRLASDSQARAGLHHASTPARTVYWIDSPLDWLQSLGSPGAPVLLVFSAQACAQRCPRLAPGVEIHGTVVLEAGCDRRRLQDWSAGHVYGQVVAGASIDGLAAGSTVVATAYAHDALRLRWPEGIDARQLQWVAGSWSLDTP